jgi:hypothetical protein
LELHRSLGFEKDIELFGISSTPCHGRFSYDNYTASAPFVTSPDFFVWLGQFKRDNGIDIVIPANDIALEHFAMNGQQTYHPHSTIYTCARKSRTYDKLQSVVRCPERYTQDTMPDEVFLKPDKGHSGYDCHHVTKYQLPFAYNGHLILEYCEGDEYTVDCFTQAGRLIYCQARTRQQIVKGISGVSVAVADHRFKALAERINSAMDFNGAWFCQFKMKGDEPVLMEVAARIGGSSGLNRAIGVNLPLADVFNWMGVDVTFAPNGAGAIYRSLSVRAELPTGDIFIDLDDTLILKGRVNWQVVAFIFKYRDSRRIHLLTRNRDPFKVLEGYGLSASIFATVCVVKPDQRKCDYVGDGLLIDDSFSERKDCQSIDPNSISIYL